MFGATATSRRSSASCKAAPGVKALERRPGKERDEKLSVPWSSHMLRVGEKLDVSQALEELVPGRRARSSELQNPERRAVGRPSVGRAPRVLRGDSHQEREGSRRSADASEHADSASHRAAEAPAVEPKRQCAEEERRHEASAEPPDAGRGSARGLRSGARSASRR
mmetsp:Transcript_38039/g.122287  ORF Transcript_38039/g.122287 Transcript_38039/m.122287 type:complete len:166 (+) Transcript_38039:59-556(+)